MSNPKEVKLNLPKVDLDELIELADQIEAVRKRVEALRTRTVYSGLTEAGRHYLGLAEEAIRLEGEQRWFEERVSGPDGSI